MNFHDPKLQQALCDRYVMQQMSPKAQRRFRKLLAQYPTLRIRLQKTEHQWALLNLNLAPNQPSPRVWQKIEQNLFIRKNMPKQPIATHTLWLKTWAIAASLMSVSLTALLWQSEPLNPEKVTILVQSQPVSGWLLESNENVFVIKTLKQITKKPGTDYELWFIADSASQPKSLGLLPSSGEHQIALPEQLLRQVNPQSLFAVTLEPRGGSPTGQPTTAPIFTGSPI